MAMNLQKLQTGLHEFLQSKFKVVIPPPPSFTAKFWKAVQRQGIFSLKSIEVANSSDFVSESSHLVSILHTHE